MAEATLDAPPKAKPNRRIKTYDARFTTAGRLTRIESWLKANAKSHWTFKFEGASDDMVKKNYVIRFHDKADFDMFRHRFSPAKPVKPANHKVDKVSAGAFNPEETPKPKTIQPKAGTPDVVDESAVPSLSQDVGGYLKYTAGHFVAALAKAFATKPKPVEQETQSNLPASFRSGAKSSSSASSSSSSSLPASFASSSNKPAAAIAKSGAPQANPRPTPQPAKAATENGPTNIVID